VPPPKIGVSNGEKLAAEIIARDYNVNIGDCFSRSWNLLKDNFWLLAGAAALIFILRFGLGPFPVLGVPASVIFGFVLQGGLGLLFLKRLRGEPADIGVAFSGFSLALLPLILAGIIAHVLTGIGFLLCVFPAIYLLVAWWLFTPLLIIDKGLDFWAAMECSRKVVTHHWWQCFGLALMAFLLKLFGGLLCLIGIFVTIPIAVGAVVCAYEDIFGRPPVASVTTPSTLTPIDAPVLPASPASTVPSGESQPTPPGAA